MSTVNNDVWHDLLENKARYVHTYIKVERVSTVRLRIAWNFLPIRVRIEPNSGEKNPFVRGREIKLIDHLTNTHPNSINHREYKQIEGLH